MSYYSESLISAHKVISDITGKLIYQDGIYVSPDIPDKISYPESGNEKCFLIEDESYWFRHRNNCIKSVIKRFCISGVILDVGGGNGFVSKMLADIGLNPILVEPHIQGCMNAKKRRVENIICGCLEDLDFNKIKVGSIGIFDVLEHIENEGKLLRTINYSLSEQGKLLISVPAHSLLWSSDDKQAGHYRRYSSKYLSDILSNNGFKIIYSSYFFNCLLLPVFLFRRLPYILDQIMNVSSYKFKKKVHVVKNNLIQYALSLFFRAELNQMQRKSISNGTSILLLAEKVL